MIRLNAFGYRAMICLLLILQCLLVDADDCPSICQSCVSGICTVHNGKNFEDEFFYNSSVYGLSMINSNVGHNINSKASINITAPSVRLQYCSFYGSDIYIKSHQLELTSTVISTSGTVQTGSGYVEGINIGCSYAGRGGYCGSDKDYELNKTNPNIFGYGSFYMDFWENIVTLGSGGICSKQAGGGHIVIIVDNIYFSKVSRITSDGYPSTKEQCSWSCTQKNAVAAGTGGYIYINTQNIYNVDQDRGIISANGGGYPAQGDPSCSGILGGSGGRIVINYADANVELIQSYLSVQGGSGDPDLKECGNGAAGTIFFKSQQMLIVSNYYKQTLSPTVIRSTNIVNTLDSLTITERAFVMPEFDSADIELVNCMNISKIIITQDSRLNCFYSPWLPRNQLRVNSTSFYAYNSTIQCGGTILINSTILEISDGTLIIAEEETISLSGDDLSILANSQIAFNHNGYEISDFDTTIFISFNTFTIESSLMSAGFVIILSNGEDPNSFSSSISSSSIISYKTTCSVDPDPGDFIRPFNITDAATPHTFTQLANHYGFLGRVEEFFTTVLTENYTIFIASNSDLNVLDTHIEGAKIGVFGTNVYIDKTTVLNASGKGCESSQGLGAGQAFSLMNPGCGPSGGSYGGYGGIGTSSYNEEKTVSDCISAKYASNFEAPIYGNLINPIHEGSGGTNQKGVFDVDGGSGGGIVMLGALQALFIDGKVLADGAAPMPYNTSLASGGSGGSIQLWMRYLQGTGNVSASGGPSYQHAGQGGGGRVKFRFLSWFDEESYEWTNFTGTYKVDSGERINSDPAAQRYSNIIEGKKGSIVSTPCITGRSGLLCKECAPGQFKSDYTNSECSLCINKPAEAGYDQNGSTTPKCHYRCNVKYLEDGMSEECVSSLLEYSVNKGGYLAFHAVVAMVLAIIFLGIARMMHTLYRMKTKSTRNRIDARRRSSWMRRQPIIPGTKRHEYQCLLEEDMANHVTRIYAYGMNLPDLPWFINASLIDFQDIKYIEHHFKGLAKEFNKAAKWSKFSSVSYKLITVLLYPLQHFLYRYYAHKKFQSLKKVVAKMNVAINESSVGRSFSKVTLKMACSKDFSLCYIDVIGQEDSLGGANLFDRQFNIHSSPLTYFLAGGGSFMSPLKIELGDPFFRNIKNSDTGEVFDVRFNRKMIEFARYFNAKALLIDFYGRPSKLTDNLAKLVEFVKEKNHSFFSQHDLIADLIAMQVPVPDKSYGEKGKPMLSIQVTILENQSQEAFENTVRDLRQIKSSSSRTDIKFALLIYSTSQMLATPWTPQDEEIVKGKDDWDSSRASGSELVDLKSDFFDKKEQRNMAALFPVVMKNHANVKEQRRKSRKNKRFFTAMEKILARFVGYKSLEKSERYNTYLVITLLIIAEMVLVWIDWVGILMGFWGQIISLILVFPLMNTVPPFLGIIAIVSEGATASRLFVMFSFLGIANRVLGTFLTLYFYRDAWMLVIDIVGIFIRSAVVYFGNTLATYKDDHTDFL